MVQAESYGKSSSMSSFQATENSQLCALVVVHRIRDDFHGGKQAQRWDTPVQHLHDTVCSRGFQPRSLFSHKLLRYRVTRSRESSGIG